VDPDLMEKILGSQTEIVQAPTPSVVHILPSPAVDERVDLALSLLLPGIPRWLHCDDSRRMTGSGGFDGSSGLQPTYSGKFRSSLPRTRNIAGGVAIALASSPGGSLGTRITAGR
jgi:hypothetical protein